jgi:CheY-like chemotaxis protein
MASAEAALGSLAGSSVDFAILDIDLGGRSGLPVAAALTKRGVPFVFTTGHDLDGLPAPYGSVPCCQKPFTLEQVAHALESVAPERDDADSPQAPDGNGASPTNGVETS